MNARLFLYTTAMVLLAACNDKKVEIQALDCHNPAVLQDIRKNLKQQITDQADQFSITDKQPLIDTDHIAAAVETVSLTLEQPQETATTPPVCHATLHAKLPDSILADATTFSPLLYGDTPLLDAARESARNQAKLTPHGEISQTIQYIPEQAKDGSWTIRYENDGFDALTQTLATLLIPYGVKPTIFLNGRLVSRETALLMRQQPEPPLPAEPNPETASETTLPENQTASIPLESSDMEILKPSNNFTPPVPIGVSRQELNTARANNQAADSEIKQVWQSIDNSIRQQLLDEQRTWIRDKNQNCRRTAAQSDDDTRAEYLRLQCDTRMTRERTQYLRGYAIP